MPFTPSRFSRNGSSRRKTTSETCPTVIFAAAFSIFSSFMKAFIQLK